MLPPKENRDRGGISLRVLLLVIALGLIPLGLLTAEPGWWSNPTPDDATSVGIRQASVAANDYGAINQGQFKNFVRFGVNEFDAHLPGGAGDTLNGMLAGWMVSARDPSVTNAFAPVNIGQVKNVAKLFYDRLADVGYSERGQYPWTSSTNSANDYADGKHRPGEERLLL